MLTLGLPRLNTVVSTRKTELTMVEVTAEVVRNLLDYNLETGVFTWKFRDIKYCNSYMGWKVVNGRDFGKPAGTKTPYGYREIKIFNKAYKEHRLAWLYVYGEWPQGQIDHINHIKDDNRIENLRDVTRSQNGMNQIKCNRKTSQYKGVAWHKRSNKWQARIGINGETKYLGIYELAIDASRAYDRAAIEYFGIYANLNFHIEDYTLEWERSKK
jgi:hypothetical protein